MIKQVTLSQAGFCGLNAVTDKLNKWAVRFGMDKLIVTVVDEYCVHSKGDNYDMRCDTEITGNQVYISVVMFIARCKSVSIG